MTSNVPVACSSLLAFGFSCVTAAAQGNDWNYSGSVYLFMPETNTSLDTAVGRVESTLSFSDALDNLDFAFMAAFEASNGTWSFIGDYLNFDLSFGDDTPGNLFSGVNTSLETQIFNGYVAYRIYETTKVDLDLAGGFRWFNTTTDLELLPGLATGRSANAEEDWVDPLVAARARFLFSDSWFGTALVDYGGFSSDSETWQILLTAGYAINDNWLIQAGYRYIEVDHEIDGNDFSFDQSGPILGATYRF